ncbi:MAG: phenylalanine--tRNA ligase subunit beta [Pseudomonadales bacterium]|jgi:phenylalanyl-tRNA synthetase beta chain|nr:phenylalanine--tRNA ligase subunit beta [Pseudomonadales bacterium]
MNILVPHSWLLEYLDTKAEPATIQKEVSLCGPAIERINEIDGERVYDIEVTTNRVDSMCVRGIAREAAVILNQAGHKANFKPHADEAPFTLDSLKVTANEKLSLPKITIKTPKINRTLCVVLDRVERTPTPDWMGKRLVAVDEKIHDSVVDITNYITHELGHPCHAFDYDKIMKLGGEIIVKQAEAGKEFVTLDGNTYKTFGDEVVFENPAGEIIDLPAIKGMLNSAIDESTKRVLFWIESLDAMTVRRASMQHAIRTVAAALNEKNVDPHLASDVFVRGVRLYESLCGAKVASEVHDFFPNADKVAPPIELNLERLNNYLGTKIDPKITKEILEKLDMKVVEKNKNVYLITPPTFRQHDVAIEVDLIEEVARIYGYHNLPSTLSFPTVVVKPQPEYDFPMEKKIINYLAALGYFEVYTYSMVSEEQALTINPNLDQYLKMANPLTTDKVYLRQSLLPSLAAVFELNNISKQPTSIFELAKVYLPSTTSEPARNREEMRFSLLSNKKYREVITDLDSLLRNLFIENYQIKEIKPAFSFAKQQAELIIGGTVIGQLIVDKQDRINIEIELALLQKFVRNYPKYQAPSKYPSIIEDLTFVINKNHHLGEVISLIKEQNQLIKKVEFVSEYNDNKTFTITYQSHKAILSNEDIAPIREKIVEALAKQKIELVGKLI